LRGHSLSGWLGVADLPYALSLAVLQGILILCWALPAAVIPIQALRLLGDAQAVSILFFAVSIVGVAGAFVVPSIAHNLGRRSIFVVGGTCVVASSILLSLDDTIPLIAGIAFRTFGFLSLDVAFEIAIMERIPRRDLARFEPARIFFMGIAFLVGPWLGVWLSLRVGLWTPFALLAILTVLVCVLTLRSGLADQPKGKRVGWRSPNPLRFIPRFVRQPWLRLAWLLTFGRSAWWTMFFIYAPIYCVESGLGEEMAGITLSAGSAAILLVPLFGRLGRRVGLRPVLAIGYLSTGLVTILIAVVADHPWTGVAFILAATVCAALIDAAGNALFMRAVHPHERAEMASVFMTYREVGQLVPPGVFAMLLSVFALPVVFAASGVSMVFLTYMTRYIPRRY
jgi:MFS family permease